MNLELDQRMCRTCNRRVLAVRKLPNHILHLLLSVLTGGSWLVVWVGIVWSSSSEPWRCPWCGGSTELVQPEPVPQEVPDPSSWNPLLGRPDPHMAVIARDGAKAYLVESPEGAAQDRPELGIDTDDVDQAFEEMSTRAPHLLHPNSSTVELKPWGAREFAMLDKTTVCVSFREWPAEG